MNSENKKMMETTINKSYTVRCPKCGDILYIVGRERLTWETMCACHDHTQTVDWRQPRDVKWELPRQNENYPNI